MVQKNEFAIGRQEMELDMGQIKRQLDMFDQRLDSIDSMLSAVVHRVTSQPVTLNTTCPKCGNNIEISLIGGGKPTR